MSYMYKCPKLAQMEYKHHHDKVAKGIHWDLCKHYGVDCGDKWYTVWALPRISGGKHECKDSVGFHYPDWQEDAKQQTRHCSCWEDQQDMP